jgi:hypothetical protein
MRDNSTVIFRATAYFPHQKPKVWDTTVSEHGIHRMRISDNHLIIEYKDGDAEEVYCNNMLIERRVWDAGLGIHQ